MKRTHKLAKKRHQNVNFGDKKSQTIVKNTKNVNSSEIKLQHSV